MNVQLAHLRLVEGFGPKPGFCVAGARRWFIAHGLDWRAFCREGIEADILSATGDPMALALVKAAQSVTPESTPRRPWATDRGGLSPGRAGDGGHG